MSKNLNIVTLNVPYPPDYGGMIDSFYRIKWLKNAGVNIHLHCFEYGRQRSMELESVCETVKYYPRENTILNHFSKIPYIVRSRNSGQLLKNLNKNEFPILFDGLHTTYFLNHPDLINRKRFVRVHNIEHHYYKSLAANETRLIRKLYYLAEYLKLNHYENVIADADNLFPISLSDHEYFSKNYQKSVYIAPFHPHEEIISLPGKGEYILYHGDLSFKENSLVAESLVRNVFSRKEFNCIIAGKNPPSSLLAFTEGKKNIRIISNPDINEMDDLIKNAHINILPVLTNNGFKMKLLMAMYAGRHCIVNKTAAINFHDASLFHIADSDKEIIEKINFLMNEEFTHDMIHERKYFLEGKFSNLRNAKKLIELIFNS